METKQVFPYKKKRRKTSSSILWNPTTHFRSGVGWPASTVKRRLTGRTCETFNTIQLTDDLFYFFDFFSQDAKRWQLLTFCWPFATTNKVKKSSGVAILTIHNQDRRSSFSSDWGMGGGGLHKNTIRDGGSTAL